MPQQLSSSRHTCRPTSNLHRGRHRPRANSRRLPSVWTRSPTTWWAFPVLTPWLLVMPACVARPTPLRSRILPSGGRAAPAKPELCDGFATQTSPAARSRREIHSSIARERHLLHRTAAGPGNSWGSDQARREFQSLDATKRRRLSVRQRQRRRDWGGPCR